MKQKRNLPDFLSLFLKVILIMIFPLQLYGEDLLQLLIFPTTGLLFTPLQNYYPTFTRESLWIISGFSTILRNFVIGVAVAFPGIYFNYKLTRTPVNKSSWKRGFGYAAAIFGFVFAMMIFLQLNMMGPIGYYNEGYYLLGMNLRLYATLVFAVFILLPMIQRQAVIIGSPVYLHDHSMKDLESNPKLALTREKSLSGILWISLCFAPYTIGANLYYYWGGLPFSSLMMSYYLGSYGRSYFTQISITLTDFTMFPFIAFMCIFQFMFVRDIYRYLSKSISRQRLFGMAILSMFGPLLLSTSLLSFMFYYMFSSLIPIPILQVVGFLAVRYHRPIADEVDRVWDEEEPRMWWETPGEKREPITSTPEKPQRHRDGDIIKVPVQYLLLSKLRQINRRRE